MRSSALLDHVEKTLSEAYRRELDQEENVWRSLPFFAATLALQLAALFQIIERLPARGTLSWTVAVSFAASSGLSTLIALLFLAASIFPAKFRYVSSETDLHEFARGLAIQSGEPPESDAIGVFKSTLAEQYADATDHNRRINQRRGRQRSIAGLATLFSVLATLALVSAVAITYVPKVQ